LSPHRSGKIADFTVRPEPTICEVMACIDRNRTGIAVVVDRDDALLGVLTDGDLRGALVAGAQLSDTVPKVIASRKAANERAAIAAPANATDGEIWGLMGQFKVRQVPILDGARVVDLVVAEELFAGWNI
jgi:CBS domain-containing protein